MDAVRQTKTDLDNLEKDSIDGLWNNDRTFSEQASIPGSFMGGWYIDQNTSHFETTNDLARSVVIYVQLCSKEREAALGLRRTPIQAARRRKNNHDIPPDEVDEL